MKTRLISLLLLSLFTVFAWADEQNVNPDINRHYQNPDFNTWVGRFESAGREVFDFRNEIIKSLELKPDTVIADIGAGTGLYTRLFAKAVPKGHVYAVDISKTFIDNIMRTCKQQSLKNVSGIVNSQKTTGLADNSIDIAFLSDTYHHFEFPKTMLAAIRRALKPKGRLVIIDFRKDPKISSSWVMHHTRLNKKEVIDEISASGYRFTKEHDYLTENYFIEFEKTDD